MVGQLTPQANDRRKPTEEVQRFCLQTGRYINKQPAEYRTYRQTNRLKSKHSAAQKDIRTDRKFDRQTSCTLERHR